MQQKHCFTKYKLRADFPCVVSGLYEQGLGQGILHISGLVQGYGNSNALEVPQPCAKQLICNFDLRWHKNRDSAINVE